MAKVIIDVMDVEYLEETVGAFNVCIDKIVNQPGCWEATVSGTLGDLTNYLENEYCVGMDEEDVQYYLSTIEK